MNDEEIMDGLMRGDASAIDCFVDRYRSRIIGFGIRQFGMSKDEAEDLAQEVTIRIWLNAQNLKENKSLSGLVNTIASNYAIDLYRRKRIIDIDRSVDVYGDSPVEYRYGYDPGEVAIREDEKRRAKITVERILAVIKPSHAEALAERYLTSGGRRVKDAARALGTKESALKTILFRARAAARKAFMEEVDVKDRADYPASGVYRRGGDDARPPLA